MNEELIVMINETEEMWKTVLCGMHCTIYVSHIDPCPLQEDAKYHLDSCGYIENSLKYTEDGNKWIGLFKVDKKRRATPEEEEAVFTLKAWDAYAKKQACKGEIHDFVAIKLECSKAEKILENKEVSFEVL